MKKINTLHLITIVWTLLVCGNAYAHEKGPVYLTPYVGAFDVSDERYRKAMAGAELRFANVHEYFVPKIGGFATTKGSSYVYAGFNLDFPFFDRQLYITPGFAVGAYAKNKGKRLGGVLEFRSSIEASYRCPNKHRIGLALSHISNASIYKKNPGEEDVVLSYSIPIN